MKFNKFAILALSALTFAACDDDNEYVAGELEDANRPNVYFAPEAQGGTYEIDPDANPGQFTITLSREEAQAAEALTVPLEVAVNDGDVFEVPEVAEFAAGATTADVVVKYPNAEEGITYNLTINIPADYISLYADGAGTNSSYKAKLSIIKWEQLEDYCYWLDGLICYPYNVMKQLPMAVKVEKATLGSEVRYRFDSPYAALHTGEVQLDSNEEHVAYIGYPYNEEGDLTGVVDKMILRFTAGGVHLNRFALGNDWGKYGPWEAGTIYGQVSNDNNYPLGKYDKDAGVVTFAPNSLFFLMNNGGEWGYYIPNQASYFCFSKEAAAAIAYPSAEEEEPTEATWTPALVGTYTHCTADITGKGCFWEPEDEVDGEAILYVCDQDQSLCKIEPWVNGSLVFTWDDDNHLFVNGAGTGVEAGANGEILASDVVTLGMDEEMVSTFNPETYAFTFNLVWHVASGGWWGIATQDVFQATGNYEAVNGRRSAKAKEGLPFRRPNVKKMLRNRDIQPKQLPLQ